MAEHAAVFAADGNAALVLRLRQNVIRAGLRNVSATSLTAGPPLPSPHRASPSSPSQVSLAYSRIHLSDAAAKLALDTPGDMESIAAKAIAHALLPETAARGQPEDCDERRRSATA